MSTVYGRCFAIHFDWVIDASGQYFSVKFNMSSHPELFIYVHERHDEVGLHWGFWPINPIQHVIHGNADYTFKLRKNLFRPLDNDGCVAEEEYSYPECVVRWARNKFVNMFQEEGGDNATGVSSVYIVE